MKCRTCARRLDLEKLDYTVGCKHEQMEGFICLACAFEGVAYWMTNISEDDYCEEYVERISNAFPTHECVKPTHECVEPTHECVEMINREDAIIAVRKHRIDIDSPHKIVRKTYEDVIRDLPFEPVGNSERLDRTCAKCKFYTKEQLCVCWSYFGFKPEDYCSRWEESDD